MPNQNQWSLVRTVEPTSEPVTVEQLRAQTRVTISDDDSSLLAYLQAARHFAEVYQNRQLCTATYRLKLDWFPSWTIKLPFSPLQSVSSITYLDTGGSTQTLDSSLYLVDTDSAPGRITPAYTKIWPVTRIQMQSVTITYVAGYATGAVPATTLHAIKLLAAHWYMNRESTTETQLHDIPCGVYELLACERVLDFSGVLGSSNNMPGAVTAWGGTDWRS